MVGHELTHRSPSLPPLPAVQHQNPELTIRLKLPRAGNDLGASEFGRVRKKTLKAEEAGGTEARRAEAEAEAAAAKRKSGAATGPVERWPQVSSAPASAPMPLWPLGTERPLAGREGSHTRSVAAAERLVDSCIGATPLEGIAAAVLLRRRAGSCAAAPGGSRRRGDWSSLIFSWWSLSVCLVNLRGGSVRCIFLFFSSFDRGLFSAEGRWNGSTWGRVTLVIREGSKLSTAALSRRV